MKKKKIKPRNGDILLSYKREIDLRTKTKPSKKKYKRTKVKDIDNRY